MKSRCGAGDHDPSVMMKVCRERRVANARTKLADVGNVDISFIECSNVPLCGCLNVVRAQVDAVVRILQAVDCFRCWLVVILPCSCGAGRGCGARGRRCGRDPSASR